jgi:hypothetical protein
MTDDPTAALPEPLAHAMQGVPVMLDATADNVKHSSPWDASQKLRPDATWDQFRQRADYHGRGNYDPSQWDEVEWFTIREYADARVAEVMLKTSIAMGFGEGADLRTPEEIGELFNRVHESGIQANDERNAVMARLHYLLGGACPATPTVPEACHPDVCDCNSPYMEMTLAELLTAAETALAAARATERAKVLAEVEAMVRALDLPWFTGQDDFTIVNACANAIAAMRGTQG